MNISLDCTAASRFLPSFSEYIAKNGDRISALISGKAVGDPSVMGWFSARGEAENALLLEISAAAKEVRENFDAFVIVGVGGSNNGSRALISALADDEIEIFYAGANLSGRDAAVLLSKLAGKRVHIDVIAKNFETLEPGAAFRVLREFLQKSGADMAKSVTVTGTKGGELHRMAMENGYRFLPFPVTMGGRYSVLSAVGLFPAAVAGIDIAQLVRGAAELEIALKSTPVPQNDAARYAVLRHLLHERGDALEFLSFFEPDLANFSKWWIQLFAESEGKDKSGLFPVACSMSEDLHSVGQYLQHGKRNLSELFIRVLDAGGDLAFPPDDGLGDGFNYLNGKRFSEINSAAFEAAKKAHEDGGAPCSVLTVPQLSPYYFGQLFYFFEFVCMLSGSLNGVDPFDQPGVEDYKREMFSLLGKK